MSKLRIKKRVRFADNFHTAMENAGAYMRDVTSRFNGFFFREPRLQYDELNSIYQSVPVVRRAVELITGHILKNGVSFTIPDNPEATAEVTALAERVQVDRLFEEAAMITLVNGCGGVLLVDKNQKPSLTLNLKKLRGITPSFTVVDGRFITTSPDLDPLSPHFYEPLEYQVMGLQVQPSWINAFKGLPVTQVLKPMYKYLGMSLIENAYQAIINDEIISKAVPNIVYRSSIVNYKIQGLKEAIKMGEEDNITKYVTIAENTKSILNATITDGDDNVEVVSRELAGLEGLDQRSVYRLSAALGIPATVLLGKSPDGQNATGAADWENFYNYIAIWQKRWYDNLRWFYKILVACVTGKDDVDFELSFNKVNLISPQQKVANDTVVLQNVQMMRDLGMPDDAINRYLIDNDMLTEDEAESYAQTLEEMEEMMPFGADMTGAEPDENEDGPKQPEGSQDLKQGTKPVKAA